jgi:nucleoside 2-deoxyribosyltransferase
MKLYLAGPEVFLPDAVAIGNRKRELCARRGFTGLFPLDNEVSGSRGDDLSKVIFLGNIHMIEEADAVVANLTPFRGVSADVGTVFEIGYAFALHKKIFAYSNVRTPYVDRVRAFVGGGTTTGSDGRPYAADDMAVENFGLFDNLMVAEAVRASGSDVVLPFSDVLDPWRDLDAFDACLRHIETIAAQVSRRVQAGR